MEGQYASCDCESCTTYYLSNPTNPGIFQNILKLAEKAFKRLHKNGGYRPEDLKNISDYRQLIGATAKLFSDQIPQEVPEKMKDYLQKDAFIFSGMRTHAQLAEAHSLLRNEKGEIRPYYRFEQDILQLNKKYNRNYLEAEYLFAKSSAQSAANWSNYSDDTGRYLLQYRTAGDERVRESHAALNRTTLSKDAGFWLSYYPPNGWRCRCTVVEVRVSRYEVSDEDKAIVEGEKATTQIGKNGKNKLEMFRFNPGKERRIFPKQNAYYPRNCKGGKVDLSGLIGHSYFVMSAEDDKCKAGKAVQEMSEQLQPQRRKAKDKEIKEWLRNNISEHGDFIKQDNFKTKEVVLLRRKVRSIADHFTENRYKDFAKDIKDIVKKSQYIDSAPLDLTKPNSAKKKRQGVTDFTYYKCFHKGENIRLNCEVIDGKEYPYSINIIIKK